MVGVAGYMSATSELWTREPFRKQARMCFEVVEDALAEDHREADDPDASDVARAVMPLRLPVSSAFSSVTR